MTRRRLSRGISLVLVGLLLVTFYSCSGFFAPQRVAWRFLNRLSNGHVWAAQQLTVERNLGLDWRAMGLYRPLFRSMRFAVNDFSWGWSVSHVSVGVQTVDLVYVLNDVSGEVTRIMMSTGPYGGSRELFYRVLRNRLREPDLPTFNFSATAQMVRVHGRWRVDLRGSDGLADAITGGMGGIIGHESTHPIRR